MPRKNLRKSYTRHFQTEVLTYLQEESEPKGEMDEEEDENESVYFMQFGEEILQVGRTQERKSQKDSLPATSVPKK